MINNKKGLTLVELIIVIIILVILLTISFFSYSNYTRYTNDSVRIADIKLIKTAMELFVLDSGKYPTPDNSHEITFNNDTVVWEQGEIGENIIKILSRLDRIPLDPKYDTKYTYSLLKDSKEFQIGTINETPDSFSIVTPTYAKTASHVSAIVDGNYNGIYTTFKLNGLYVMYALPSIILPDLDHNLEISEMGSGSLVLKGKKCLPHSYKNFSDVCVTDFVPQLLFIGSNLPVTEEEIMVIIKKLQEIYSNPVFSTNPEYSDIINIDTSNTGAVVNAFSDALEGQIPEYVYDTWSTIIDMGVEEYEEIYGDLDLISGTGGTSSGTGIVFLSVNVGDPDGGSVSCNSCIDFNN